ncbi:SDR family NAD(P)-dependent oxidoreductase [Streptomyces nymphaeiformis]|uniref:NAD(P)-dependent dehydrogenase (Short-subunit alcohol dehydrogenase family) n=1 Tax=Streptomyces nymphaeiformis TaxID=2663842 RepID=A0A7W7TX41_9ACTN|nr:SDR family oxidoreductase [Streptomyces nymphaeiformis]MBB4979590.1 NAD(P)-dependent dehydrogenase (short-subunit alcohol dehydrogenase family) [Streptomyces nymphaeiformis]
MSARFTDRTVLVTGAGSGLGRAIALAFAAEGAKVVVAGRTTESLDGTVALIEAAGGTAAAVAADVSSAESTRELVRRAVGLYGGLDVAVNNAGVFRGGGHSAADFPLEDWQALLDINVTGVLHALQAEVAHMRANGGGAIVNIASNLGPHVRIPGVFGYQVSKAAVSALTRAAALDHIGDGVRINAVSPGAAESTMSLRPGETEAEREVRMKAESPLGRISSAAEVAAAVLYLASDDAGSAVGTDLVIDGGVSA